MLSSTSSTSATVGGLRHAAEYPIGQAVEVGMRDPIDLREALSGKSPADLSTDPLEKIRAAGAHLGPFDAGDITLGHFKGTTPWERHVEGDELFHVLDGELHVTLLHTDDDGCDEFTVPTGAVFVVPRGRWHRAVANEPVKLLTLRSTDHGPVSFEDDPRG